MLVTIQALLGAPNPDDPLDEDRRDVWNDWPEGTDRQQPSNPEPSEVYLKTVEEWK